MRKLEKSKKTKKPFYKRWRVYAYSFAAVVMLGWILDVTGWFDANDAKLAAEEAPVKTAADYEATRKANAAANERMRERDKAAAEAKAAADVKAEETKASEFAVNAETLAEMYDLIYEEAEGAIVKIEPADDYEIINVQLTEEFAYLPVEMKQAIVDALGGKIEATTRAIMFDQRPSADKLYVYFVNAKGEHLVDTKHLDYGWKAK